MLNLPSRQLINIEKRFLISKEKIQFALEVRNPDLIPIIIQNFKNRNLGLHLRLEGENFIWHEKPIHIHSLPNNIKSAKDACDFINSIKYDFNDTLSIIAANNNIVAVSASHVVCDGGFFKDIYNQLLINVKNYQLKPTTPLIAPDLFQSELSRVTKQDIQNQHKLLDKITTLNWSKNYEKLSNEQNKNKKCNYYIDESPVEDFNFHKSKVNLTDFYNFSLILSIMSINGQMDSIFGTNTTIDLRHYLPKKEHPASNIQNASIVSVVADHITPKMTVSEVISSLHQDLMRKLNDNWPFIVYKCFLENEFFSSKKCVSLPNLSNIGRFKLDDEFAAEVNDTWIQQNDLSKFAEGKCFLLAFSREKYGKNILVTRLQQSCSVVNDADANRLFRSIMHVMKEVPVNVTVQEAYDELRSFQNMIKQ